MVGVRWMQGAADVAWGGPAQMAEPPLRPHLVGEAFDLLAGQPDGVLHDVLELGVPCRQSWKRGAKLLS